MNKWKMIMGAISLILGAFLLFESFKVMDTAQVFGVNNFAIYAGAIVSLIYIGVGILIFVLNNRKEKIANIIIAVLCIIGFLLSFLGPVIFVDLPYCSVWAVICFITVCISFFRKKDSSQDYNIGKANLLGDSNSITCPYCGAANYANSKYCGTCGKVIESSLRCPYCGASVKEGDTFCQNCGERVDEEPSEEMQETTQKKCPCCGVFVNEGDVFCENCGKKLDESPSVETLEITKKECPHCGTLVHENDVTCDRCGRLLVEGVEEEYEEKTFKDYLPYVIAALVVLVLLGGGWWYWDSSNKRAAREKAIADSLEIVRQDSIKMEQIKEKHKRLDEEKRLRFESIKNYVEKFYKEYEKTENQDEYLQKHCTNNALDYLRRVFPYDCDNDDCLATWVFFYEAGTDAETIERIFVVEDINTCIVKNMHASGSMYCVTIGIKEENNQFKIDKISTKSY